MISHQPIGIFDSGVGGLTVAHAVRTCLPHEDIVYFGDTLHLPYGDKSVPTIQSYAIKICDFLLKKHCKVILIACNSASTAAYDLIKDYVGEQAQVLDVIDPVVTVLAAHYTHANIGLIGTRQTVSSRVYENKLYALNQTIHLKSLATPLLAPMIEEGYCHNKITQSVIEEYLHDPVLENIQALVLACTHYPLIKDQISQFYKNKVEVIDGSVLVANRLMQLLLEKNIKNEQKKQGEVHFYVSDYTDSFSQSAKLFFQDKIQLEHCLFEG